MRLLPLCLAALSVTSVARADWEYTRWGMTPDQVVAVSGGRAQLLPEARRPRVPPLVTAATGEFTDGPLRLRTVFSFNIESGGLACVTIGVRNKADDEAFKAFLVRRHGAPQTTSGIAFLGQTNLGWQIGVDEIEASFGKDDPGYAMHCRRD